MYKILKVTVVFTVLSVVGVTQSSIAPAGKCRTFDITTVPLDFETLAKLGNWEVIYVPDSEHFQDVDHELRDLVITSNNTCKLKNSKRKSNSSNELYEFTLTYADGILLEDIVDESGTPHRFRNYPLALTNESALLYYRCSDTGTLDIDTRYIVIPRKNNLSADGLRELTCADKSYSRFRGKLRRLEKQFL